MKLACDLSIIVACYNEALLLEKSVERLVSTLELVRRRYEIIFVDDCSTDGTQTLIEALIARYPKITMKAFYHSSNKGRGAAVTTGFREASGQIIGYLDIDLEVAPHYILPCIDALEHGAHVATAHRIYKFHLHSALREVLSRGYVRLVQGILNISLSDTETGFKFFRREALFDLLEKVHDPHWFWDTEIMTKASREGYKIVELPSLFIRRNDKKSSVRLVRDTWYYLRRLIQFRRELQESRLGTVREAPSVVVEFEQTGS